MTSAGDKSPSAGGAIGGADSREERRWGAGKRAVQRVFDVGMWLSELVMLAMVALITTEIVSRTFFDFSLEISDEVSGYLLVAITFLGVSASMRSDVMFRVEFIINLLPPIGKTTAMLVLYLLSLNFAAVLDYQLIRLVISSYERAVVANTLLATPQYLPQLIMPIGMTLLVIELVIQVGIHTVRLAHALSPDHRGA